MNWLADTIKTQGKPNFPCQDVGVSDSGGIKFRMDSTYFEINDNAIIFKDAETWLPGRTDIVDADPVRLTGTLLPSQYGLAYLHLKTPSVTEAEPGTLLSGGLSNATPHVKKFLCRILEAAADAGVDEGTLIKEIQLTNTPPSLVATQAGVYAEFMEPRVHAKEPLQLGINEFVAARSTLSFLLGRKGRSDGYENEKYLVVEPENGLAGLAAGWERELTGLPSRSVIAASDGQSVVVAVDGSRFRAVKSKKGIVLVGAVYDCLIKQRSLQNELTWRKKANNIALDINVDDYVPSKRTLVTILEEERSLDNARLRVLAERRTPEEVALHRKQHVADLPIF